MFTLEDIYHWMAQVTSPCPFSDSPETAADIVHNFLPTSPRINTACSPSSITSSSFATGHHQAMFEPGYRQPAQLYQVPQLSSCSRCNSLITSSICRISALVLPGPRALLQLGAIRNHLCLGIMSATRRRNFTMCHNCLGVCSAIH